jgi:hypothetical protein
MSADRLLGEATQGPPIRLTHDDINGDGRVEVTVQTAALSLTLNPEAGGSLTEIGYVSKSLDLGDVLTRRPEAYHSQVVAAAPRLDGSRVATIHAGILRKEEGLDALLAYDRFRRASLLDGLFPAGGPLDPLTPWPRALLSFGDRRMRLEIQSFPEQVIIMFSPENTEGWALELQKTVIVPWSGAELRVSYRLRWTGVEPIQARWGVQWNLAMTAGNAPGRFYELPGAPSLGSQGEAPELCGVGLVDEWSGCAARLGWGRPATVSWAPVETVSLSEAGLERIYQGSSLLLVWPLSLSSGEEWEEHIAFTVRDTQ